MKVCVVGLGYIGFPTACIVSQAGHDVVGVDVNAELIEKLNNGGLHIPNEDGLGEIAEKAFASGKLRVTAVPEPADVFILAVPTPYRALPVGVKACGVAWEAAACAERAGESCSLPAQAQDTRPGDQPGVLHYGADLTYVEQAAREIVPYVCPGNMVVLESTVSPGTTDTLVRRILEEGTGLKCGHDIYLAHAPERVLPGRILKELTENDRIVGGVDEESTKRAVAFYKTFVRGNVAGTDATTAELVKLMENTFRDVNIALANEFALICERVGVDVHEAIALANRHPRVKILQPGPGVGGHCIAVDPYFIVEAAPEQAQLISTARRINSAMPGHVVHLVQCVSAQAAQRGTPVRRVLALGASYKPNVGDDRESPALEVAGLLKDQGYEVSVHDPYIARFSGQSLETLLEDADLLLMLTDHEVYRQALRPKEALARMRQALIVDTRNFFGREWDAAGFSVVRLGVGKRPQ